MQNICAEACALVQAVGSFIKGEVGKVSVDAISDKSLNNLVSYVDKTAEAQLVKGLRDIVRNANILAEEGTKVAHSHSPYTWIIDPLDGTTNFIHGLPFFSISVALARDGVLVMGIVYEVMRGELFYAYEGSPAFLNDRIISVSKTTALNDTLLATGFPYYKFENADKYLHLFADLMQNSRGIRRLGSAALDLAYTACGRFDAYFEYNLQPWDVAAGGFIVQQAGGTVTDWHNNANGWQNGSAVLADNKVLHTDLMQKIAKYW